MNSKGRGLRAATFPSTGWVSSPTVTLGYKSRYPSVGSFWHRG